jgi:hypothetical protein
MKNKNMCCGAGTARSRIIFIFGAGAASKCTIFGI